MKLKLNRPKCEVPSTAMGDIAFNLLVFFVILAKSADDSHVAWVPASAPLVVNAGFSKVTVIIDKDQKVYINGAEVGQQQLQKQISDILEGAVAGERKVLLKVHTTTPATTFQPVIEAVSQAGGEMWHILNEDEGKSAPAKT